MHRRLLVAAEVVAKVRVLLQRLPDTGHIAMAEDPKTTGEEWLFLAVPVNVLVLEKCNQRLSYRESPRLHGFLR